jgi:hypothetical protein
MARKVRPSVIRPDARRVEVYSEGLCVYLHDAGHADRLRRMLASGQAEAQGGGARWRRKVYGTVTSRKLAGIDPGISVARNRPGFYNPVKTPLASRDGGADGIPRGRR